MTAGVVGHQEMLRSRTFDGVFVGGIAAVAIASALVVAAVPSLFGIVLLLDVWLLGYPHVVATFGRFATDDSTRAAHRGLLVWWPPAIAAAVVLLALGVGLWAVATVYFFWQWFHYVRQSWGVTRAYERKAAAPPPEHPVLLLAAFYSVPVWGLLHRSSQAPETFLGVGLRTVPVPALLVDAAGAVALAVVAAVVLVRFQAWRRGDLPVVHTLMVSSHVAVFAVGYLVIDDLDTGWLAVNIWHNAQYLAFVWHVTNRQGAKTSDPSVPGLIDRIGRRFVTFLLATIVVSTVIYVVVGLTLAALVPPLIVYQAVNFHHYVVDGQIWKLRRPSVQRAVGVA